MGQVITQPVTTSGAPASPGRRRFFVASGVLLVAALGLNFAVQALQLHFKKEPVPMRLRFGDAMPPRIGDWVQVARNDSMDADMLQALGTDQYLFCKYVNAKALGLTPEAAEKELAGKSFEEQSKWLDQALARQAGGGRLRSAMPVVSLGLSYYTGKADTVAHIPERCYVADGYDPVNPTSESWELDAGRSVPVRRITFENQVASSQRLPCNVAYFFNTNGEYESDSLRVRAKLQDLFARYGYYAKVELMCVAPQGQDQEAWRHMRDFLSAALPRVEQALPVWAEYRDRKN
jgi:hypothetical protein